MVRFSAVRRRTFRRRPAAGRSEVFHHHAGRHRAWEIVEAERRDARAFPALLLSRHGRGRLSDDHEGSGHPASEAGDGDVHGRDAHLGVGRNYPDFMDALMPLASAPVEIAGRNRLLRDMIMDRSLRTRTIRTAITTIPFMDWKPRSTA